MKTDNDLKFLERRDRRLVRVKKLLFLLDISLLLSSSLFFSLLLRCCLFFLVLLFRCWTYPPFLFSHSLSLCVPTLSLSTTNNRLHYQQQIFKVKCKDGVLFYYQLLQACSESTFSCFTFSCISQSMYSSCFEY